MDESILFHKRRKEMKKLNRPDAGSVIFDRHTKLKELKQHRKKKNL